jgi:hypothetical protein
MAKAGRTDKDFSEKARIPAWTDRILRKGSNLRQLAYNSAPLRFSDHRPVYAVFECTVNIVNERLRDKISREVYERRKAEVGGDTANLVGNESEDEDLIGYDAIEPGLPPASSDRQKWWLDNGKMAKSSIRPPKPDNAASQTILNPKRPTNPHVPTDEPDWVSVPRSESRLSSFSSMSTSPYEHVNHSMLLSSSASSSVPRKLPPPYDPSALPAKVGRLQISEDRHNSHSPPPPPPPRRPTGAVPEGPSPNSTAPSRPQKRKSINKAAPAPPVGPKPIVSQEQVTKHKAAPPVARKPAHLTAPVSPVSSFASSEATVHGSSEASSFPDIPRRSTSSINSSRSQLAESLASLPRRSAELTAPPAQYQQQPSRRTDTGNGGVPTGTRSAPPVGGVPLPGLERKPPLPARKPAVAVLAAGQRHGPPPPPAPQRAPTVDLLGDDAGVEMGSWEALRPS